MRFVDANVFIYTLVKSPKEAYETCRRILRRIENGEEAVTNTAIIQEVADWLDYNNRKREVKSFMTAINSYLTMHKANTTWDEMLAALNDVEEHALDFVDALTLQTMKKNKITEIYSNDTDFDRVKWIKRIWE
ncbi:MAG: type II toxin-antitoxin system VapC family toxin [Candidatus Geothermarchaeales archaeon]